jgi:hypothetical protein
MTNALEIMNEIDEMLFDKLGEKEHAKLEGELGSILEYRASGSSDGIFFLNNCVYCSENTYREWDDEKDDYKLSLKELVIQEINKFIDVVSKLKIEDHEDDKVDEQEEDEV